MNIVWTYSILLVLSFFLLMSRCGETGSPDEINSMGLSGRSYLEISGNAVLDSILSGDFSIEIWVRADTSLPDSQRAILMIGNELGGTEIGFFQGDSDSSRIDFVIDEDTLGGFHPASLDWRKQTFHQICITRQETHVRFYFDGWEIASFALAEIDIDIGLSNLLIGGAYRSAGCNAGARNFWTGLVDEVRLWDRCLGSDEVLFHQNHPDKLFEHFLGSQSVPPVGIWRFNESREDYIPDETGNGNPAWIRGSSGSIFWSESGAD
ncbi:MAG: LamG domain-containing protein [Candidatus Neomarinimicrobiota bacterium]